MSPDLITEAGTNQIIALGDWTHPVSVFFFFFFFFFFFAIKYTFVDSKLFLLLDFRTDY